MNIVQWNKQWLLIVDRSVVDCKHSDVKAPSACSTAPALMRSVRFPSLFLSYARTDCMCLYCATWWCFYRLYRITGYLRRKSLKLLTCLKIWQIINKKKTYYVYVQMGLEVIIKPYFKKWINGNGQKTMIINLHDPKMVFLFLMSN